MEAPLRYVLVRLTVLLIPVLLHGQPSGIIPHTIPVQMYLERSGQPVSGIHTVEVSWFTSVDGGVAKHSESFTTDVTRGVVTLYLGSIRAVPVELLTSGPHWLGVRVDGGEELLPRTPVLSVPYAMLASHALVADSVRSGGAPPPLTTECGVVAPVQGQTRFLITPQQPVPPRYWIDARVEAPTSIAVRIGTVDLATNTIELFTAAPLSRHETLSWCIRW
ncbi:MAG: hypothetical protein ACO3I4_07505 [Candidatus Kapaibacteriota bacterium]